MKKYGLSMIAVMVVLSVNLTGCHSKTIKKSDASMTYKGLGPRGILVPIANPNTTTLQHDFPVYVITSSHTVINHPYPGAIKKILPVYQDTNAKHGCYLTCYARDKKDGVYQSYKDIYTMGMLRVSGQYSHTSRLCVPNGTTEKTDISADARFKNLCNHAIPTCKNTPDECWAGGDTGGWFGMQ